MREELLDLRGAELDRVALAVEQDEAAHPIHVGVFCANRVVPQANLVAHLIQQAARWRWWIGLQALFDGWRLAV